MQYIETITKAYRDYWSYLVREILHPHWGNYFYWLIGVSLVVWSLEILFPWRKQQSNFRKGFWLDTFYMFFNFFLFSLILYNALSNVAVEFFESILASIGVRNLVAVEIASWPVVAQWLSLFVLADFLQWNIHRLLHRVPWLWKFHQVHHSVKEMGFAAQFRFHWMETIVYKTIQYIPLSMIGFGIDDFFIVHMTAVTIGHLNHANLGWDYGPLKYILNNPKMHIWHHSRSLPEAHHYGANFGLSLSLWDYLFGTAYVPTNGRNIPLGFEYDEEFPEDFLGHNVYPLRKGK